MKIFLIFVSLIVVINLSATIINVPADQLTIQAGIDVAIDADTVLVQPGTYIENINYNGKNITVASLYLTTQDSTYIDETIIDGGTNGSVVRFENEETQVAMLSGFTITNGYSLTSGGGIGCVNASSPQLGYLIITNNSAEYNGGGLIIGAYSSPSLEAVLITGNSANAGGGGIYCFNDCNPSLESVTISNNEALNGGGICCIENSSPNLENVAIINNSAIESGGGLLCFSNSNANLQDVTITSNSSTDEGGGVYCETSDLTFNNVNIEDNDSDLGGGIYCENSDLTLNSVNIENNDGDLGGGIYCDLSNSTLNNVSILGNSATAGGGIFLVESNPDLDSVIISANEALENGAGLFCLENSNPSLINVEISENTVTNTDGWGGGICCMLNSSPSLEYVSLTNNSADVGGGLCMDNSNPTLQYVSIICNSASTGGGIYCSMESSPSLINVLIFDNSATSVGGGISCYYSNPYLLNVTIADNSADEGGGIYCQAESDVELINSILWNISPTEIYFASSDGPNSITTSYSDIKYGEAGIETNNNGTVSWMEGNINELPMFMETGANPYRLNNMSPCVNAGTPDLSGLNLPEYDIIGNPRVYGSRIDMGAYENQNVAVGTESDLIPHFTNLNQNYPNPFNPSTTIEFSIQNNSKVELSVYNIRGQKINTLIHNELTKGLHSITWNGDDESGKPMSSGIYYYKLNVNGKSSAVKKCLLLK